MKNITGIKKIICGVRRYGILRTVLGLMTFLRYKLLRPKNCIIKTITNPINVHFKYPSQFMPTLAIFKELIEPEYEFLQKILNKESVVFDVGGGIGTYSVVAAKIVDGPVHVFEPTKQVLMR